VEPSVGLAHSLAMVAAASVATLGFARVAEAQQETAPVEATGKGITGGALLGAEAALLTEALLDVQPAWAYVVGGAMGAGVGGFGGYYAERAATAKLSLYLLAGGMALAIPTTVAVLSVTAYEPPADYTEDQGPEEGEPVAEPPEPENEAVEVGDVARRKNPGRRRPLSQERRQSRSPSTGKGQYLQARTPAPPVSLVGICGGQLTLSVPDLQVLEVFNRRELFEYGLSPATEVRIGVLAGVF
jgi:hypothetical protein